MSDVTVVGLGLMGSALARAMMRAGHDLTVWNRSSGRMLPFANEGIATSTDVVAALLASPICLVCIDSYTTTRALLELDEAALALRGKTIVQLSTGTPTEATDAAVRMNELNAHYLDGAILGGPQHIGTEHCQILFSGSREAFERAEIVLACLGGRIRYLGEEYKAANVLDLAWLCDSYGQFLSATHAALICESEGVGLDALMSLFSRRTAIHHYISTIESGNFEERSATLQVWADALKKIQVQSTEQGISSAFPDYIARLFSAAIESGYSDEHVMALIKVLRKSNAGESL